MIVSKLHYLLFFVMVLLEAGQHPSLGNATRLRGNFDLSDQTLTQTEPSPSQPTVRQSRLFEGVMQRDVLAIQAALADGESVNLPNVHHWTPALLAALLPDLSSLQVLVGAGADVNVPDEDGVFPLMVTAAKGEREMVQVLLDAGANPLYLDADGKSAYDYAADAGHKLLALMIAENAVIFGMNYRNDLGVLAYLSAGVDVNICNLVGWTPLIYFAHYGHIEGVATVLKKYEQIDVNAVDVDGWTALHHTCYDSHHPIVALLLHNPLQPVDLSLRNRDGHTAIDIARRQPDSGIVQALEYYDIQQKTARGEL